MQIYDGLNSLKSFDFFSTTLPSFNLKGESDVKTPTGGALSIVIRILTFSFALIKLQHLASHKNPSVIATDFKLDDDEVYEVARSEFMVAVALEHWLTGRRDDPKYTYWGMVDRRIISNDEGFEELKDWYLGHKCTDEEFERFFPIEDISVNKVQRLQAEGQFKCFDMHKIHDFKGSWRSHDNYNAIDIGLFPCASSIQMHDGTMYGGHDGCEWDH